MGSLAPERFFKFSSTKKIAPPLNQTYAYDDRTHAVKDNVERRVMRMLENHDRVRANVLAANGKINVAA